MPCPLAQNRLASSPLKTATRLGAQYSGQCTAMKSRRCAGSAATLPPSALTAPPRAPSEECVTRPSGGSGKVSFCDSDRWG
eukprot:4561246-Pyramimonas_sp.AAC.2